MSATGAPALNASTALSLATAAYAADIPTCLRNNVPGWSVAWQPDQEVDGNLAFIAYDGSSQYVVAIRGSETSLSLATLLNWFDQDLNIFHQVPWNYPPVQNALIAQGVANGLSNLTQLVHTPTGGQPVSILQFLTSTALAQNASIGVVGHSLGGNLATVFAPWLLYQITSSGKKAPSLFPVFTFAAPTAGNQAFAKFYDSQFPQSWRYYNKTDIAPMVADNVAGIGNQFSPSPEASQISVTVTFPKDVPIIGGMTVTITLQNFFSAVALALQLVGLQYSQTNAARGSVELVTPASSCKPSGNFLIEQWFSVAACQHSTATYFANLGATPFICP